MKRELIFDRKGSQEILLSESLRAFVFVCQASYCFTNILLVCFLAFIVMIGSVVVIAISLDAALHVWMSKPEAL